MHARHISVIVVVDDEPLIAKSLAMILKREGYSVSYFTNPVDALEFMRKTPTDLLISDVMMPQLSGVELAMRVAIEFRRCKILLFSGNAGTRDLLQNAREKGHNFMLLAKPIHPNKLLRQIEHLEVGADLTN